MNSKSKKAEQMSAVLCALMFTISLVDLSLMFLMEARPGADPLELGIRNISSVICFWAAGIFFESYYLAHKSHLQFYMKPLKISATFLAVASLIKVIISLYYLFVCIIGGNLIVLWLYVGDILIWTAVAIFAILYRKKFVK